MTVSAQLNELSEIPAFKDCSEEALERIRAEGNSVRFSIGHILSDASIVPIEHFYYSVAKLACLVATTVN